MTQNQPIKKPTLALVIPSLTPGGAERVFSNIANHLANRYNIYIFTLYKDLIFYDLHPSIKINYCLEEYRSNVNRLTSLKIHFQLFSRLKRKVSDINADLILSFTTTANFYTVILSKILNIPSVISERIHPKYALNKAWQILVRHSYKYTTILVVQTEEIKNYFKKSLKDNKLKIIENPLSEHLISKKNAALKRSNSILSIGRLESQKNQELLLRAFSKLNHNDWELLIIGSGSLLDYYKELSYSLKIESQVTFLGAIKDVSPFLNQEGIFVLTSNFEGSPNVLIEAMYFEMPCISTDCPSGPNELIVNNHNGILIPTNNEQNLIDELNRLMNNSDLRNQLGKAAGASVNRFMPDSALKRWEDLIENTLK